MTDSARSDLEKFIGENLLSKIGILILILGVAIGAKYAIDQGWVSPLVRIISGYAIGLGLVALALWLQAKYEMFSSVLLSGGMAVMYFITYFGYSLYQLFDQTAAFMAMAIFTVFTVAAAIVFSRQIIAHLGLVGAYAVPFLLNDNSGRYSFLFTYIAIINVGILAVSLSRYWKSLFYTSFILTWATYYFWWTAKYSDTEHFGIACAFAAIYFFVFYGTFIGYKLRSGENVALENVSLILANSFIFYGFGHELLDGHAGYAGYLGAFTLGNAGVHLAFGVGASRIKTISTDFIYLLGALVLTFITITIPVEFHGHTITLVWSAEAAVLFWIGRTKLRPLFEHFSYALMVLATFSLVFELGSLSFFDTGKTLAEAVSFPFFSPFFVTSIFYAAAFALICYKNRDMRFEPTLHDNIRELITIAAAAASTFVFYNAFRGEIADYFAFLRYKTAIGLDISSFVRADHYNEDYSYFGVVWQINYTMVFLSAMALINVGWFRERALAVVNLIADLLVLFVFIAGGLLALSLLRESYLSAADTEYFHHGMFNIAIRYVSYIFVAGLFATIYCYTRQSFLAGSLAAKGLSKLFEMLLTVALLFILSSELLNWMDILGQKGSYKLGLSILWGVYSLALVAIGIFFGRKHLRVSSIVLFGVTLVKVFFYDIENLSTLAKTTVFVSLGGLMLVVSFLYHKYKAIIFAAAVDNEDAGE